METWGGGTRKLGDSMWLQWVMYITGKNKGGSRREVGERKNGVFKTGIRNKKCTFNGNWGGHRMKKRHQKTV